jgi:cytochrome c-type biogenesis protein CcmE
VKRYWKFVVPAAVAVGLLVILVVNLNSSLVYFNTPTELSEIDADDARRRLGGQVVPGTVSATAQGVSFAVSDGRDVVQVHHVGATQELFREGIGVVVEGTWDGSSFHSDTMLVKHDEEYGTDDGVYDPDHPDLPDDSTGDPAGSASGET